MEKELIKLIKKYSAFTWYCIFDRILKNTTEEWRKIRECAFSEVSSDFHIQNYIIALFLPKILVHAEVNRNNESIDFNDLKNTSKILYELITSASDFICAKDISLNICTVWCYSRGWQSVHYIQCKSFAQLHRILYLFCEVPFSSEMKQYNEEHCINFREMFYSVFNIEVDEYIKFCFLLFFNFEMGGSVLEIAPFIESCKKLISQDFNAEILLSLFYADDATVIAYENSVFPRDKRYKYNAVPLLKNNPILKSRHGNKEEIYMPFTYLALEKSMDLIYFKLKERHEKSFTAWFGRLFQEYCGKILKKTFVDAEVLPDIFSKKNDSSLDFVILKNDTAILIECKAARIYRTFTESEDLDEINKIFVHIKKAHGQLTGFVNRFGERKGNFEKFENIINIYGLIIIWDEFSPKILDAHMKTFIQHDNSDFKDLIPFKILSINMLEHLQASLSLSANQVDKFVKIYQKNNNEEYEKLIMSSKIGNSFLNEYYRKFVENWIPREFIPSEFYS